MMQIRIGLYYGLREPSNLLRKGGEQKTGADNGWRHTFKVSIKAVSAEQDKKNF
jgi:hypothetical protein